MPRFETEKKRRHDAIKAAVKAEYQNLISDGSSRIMVQDYLARKYGKSRLTIYKYATE